MTARPFLKWAGGKGALLHEILPRLPAKLGTYYEPFLGGGAVFFALAAERKQRFRTAVLGDANKDLVRAYKTLAWNTDAVIKRLQTHARLHDEDYYYKVRALRTTDEVAQAARIIYLNRTCFNGLYRVNKKGQFNVPFGAYANPTICDEENLREVAEALGAIRLLEDDFENVVSGARPGDTVYFDPPYVPLSNTSSFTAFVKGGFGEAEQVRLRDCFRALDQRGVHVLLSNSDTPLVRKLYHGGFCIETVEAPRRLNSKGGKRGNVSELLISGRNSR